MLLRTLVRRIVTGLFTLWIVTLLVFLLIRLAPGSPLPTAGPSGDLLRLTPHAEAELRRIYRLDEPLARQYALWLGDLLQGDLGRSVHDRRPVTERIGERVGITIVLNLGALLLMVGVAVPLGSIAALRPGSGIDRVGGAAVYLLYSVPVFWAALLLQTGLSSRLGWLPLAGLASPGAESLSAPARWLDLARHLVLPVVCLAYSGIAYLSRFVRAALLEQSGGTAALAARARGLSERAALVRHGFRLAALPLLTLAGFVLPSLFAGSVIVETIFAIPGLGRLFYDAAFQRDMPVLLGLTLLSGAATLAGVLLADVAYAFADPRIRRG